MSNEKITKTKQEVLDFFKKNLHRAFLYQKVSHINARKAVNGEHIKTIIDNKVETEHTATDEDIVVQGTVGELYVMKEKDFLNNYFLDTPLSNNFQSYKSKRQIIAMLYHGESFYFESPWQNYMLIEDGDYLGTDSLSNPEVYRLERKVFKETYQKIKWNIREHLLLEQINQYLSNHNWKLTQTFDYCTKWESTEFKMTFFPEFMEQIIVPKREASDYFDRVEGLIQNLVVLEKRSPKDIIEDMLAY
jgi:hypothetical protein